MVWRWEADKEGICSSLLFFITIPVCVRVLCACLPPALSPQDWIMIALGISIVVVTGIAFIFYR